MDDTQLETFIAIVNYQNFAKAAERLYVTQPTVVARIKTLENELNTKLFIKEGKHVVLTKEGEIFLKYALQTLAYMDESKIAISVSKEPKIKVGFSPGFSSSFILETINAIRSENNLTISIIEGEDSIELTKQLMNGELHLVFTRNSVIHESDIVSEHLFDDEIIFICSKDHRLGQLENVTIDDLQGETLICYRQNSLLWTEIDRKLIGVRDMKRIEVGSNELLKSIVKHGWGVSFIASLGLDATDRTSIVSKEIKKIGNIPHKVYVQYKANSLIENHIKKLIYSFISLEIEVRHWANNGETN
jgi:DNA-binding transcriptional LysR family regulator